MAFVPVADLERAATFYDRCGLDLVSSVPGVVCVFDAGGTALRVTAVADHVAAGWTVVGWAVPDLGSALRQLGESGVEPELVPGDDGGRRHLDRTGRRPHRLADRSGRERAVADPVRGRRTRRPGDRADLPDADLAAGDRAYSRLGFTTSSFDVDGTAIYGFLERNGVHVHLAPFDELDPASTTSAAYLYVDDADALSAEWGAARVEGASIRAATPTTDCARAPTSIPTATSSASAPSSDLQRLVPDARRCRWSLSRTVELRRRTGMDITSNDTDPLPSADVHVIGEGSAVSPRRQLVARSGRSVVVHEQLSGLGGRAVTDDVHGFRFNRGPHAWYLDGEGAAVLQRLGLTPTGSPPATAGAQVAFRGRTYLAPGGATSLLRTRPAAVRRDKADFAMVMRRLSALDASESDPLIGTPARRRSQRS